ncbi:DUF5654 family protein [Candidatus Pacearchaeota archaeon]|nr:DUF5654 family protein [Candidatus Pacearchaeota archaeon]
MPKKKTSKKTKLDIRESAKKFNTEIKKATNTAIIAAFGFIVALAWRDVITEYVENFVKLSPISGKIISALIITLISVIGILIVTKLTSVKE